jgi:Protein of unknown function (DUF674)
MTLTTRNEFQLKLLIEKESQKLLFAEVGKDVVDFLMSLLSLPIGSVTKLITQESAFDCLRNTYNSWEQLNSRFLSSDRMIPCNIIPSVSPTSSYNFARLLSRANPATMREKLYICNCINDFDDMYKKFCPNCRKINKYSEILYAGSNVTKEEVERDGYVKGFTYALMDDLSIMPMTPLASIGLLNRWGHKDLNLLEEKTVRLNIDKVNFFLRFLFKLISTPMYVNVIAFNFLFVCLFVTS